MKNKLKQIVMNKSDAEETATKRRPSSLPDLGRRLLALYDAVGTRQKAAEISGRSTDQLIKWAKGQAEPPFAPLAKLCKAAGVSLEWLAFDKGPMLTSETAPDSHSHDLRLEDLTMAVQLVDEVLEGKFLPREKRAELIALVYDGLVDGLPEAKLLPWVRAAAG